MLTYPHFPARTTHDLSGVWDFAFLGDSDFDKLDPSNIRFADKMAVPGVFDASPAYGYGGVYRDVVWTELRGALFLDRVRVTMTDLDLGMVRLDCLLRGRVAAARDLSVSFDGGKPFILSEIGAAALYGWRDPLHAHYSEEYQAEYLGIVCRKVMKDPEIAGVSLWQFCDCRTFVSAKALGRPRTFNNKGTFDEYRRPKQAAQAIRRWFRDDD